jgi:pimeloyl-ACP methyl ester carboxylesterase
MWLRKGDGHMSDTAIFYSHETENHYGRFIARPDLTGILIPGARGKLLTKLYLTAGREKHPVILLLHGIPGTEQNIDLAQYFRRQGFHVLVFHYSGSWGSDGDYSLKNNLEDADTVLDYIIENEQYSFDKDRIFAVGHSLGGFVCGQLIAHRREIKAGALLMPCDIGRLPAIKKENPKLYDDLIALLDESADWLHGTSGEALRKEAEENADNFALETIAPLLTDVPLLCFTGTLDEITPDEICCRPMRNVIIKHGGTRLRHISYPTDHFFSDYRLTVAKDISDFLLEQCKNK